MKLCWLEFCTNAHASLIVRRTMPLKRGKFNPLGFLDARSRFGTRAGGHGDATPAPRAIGHREVRDKTLKIEPLWQKRHYRNSNVQDYSELF